MRENMDVDGDVDQNLLQQFSCLGTTDREVLISELHKLVGNQLNPAGCAFFLDMNNWNLQAAVCSYYDYFESPAAKLPCMAFVADITVGEGESVCPSTKFIKTWRLKNSGEESWPAGCRLKFVQGDHFGHRDDILVDRLLPSKEVTDISVEMVSPDRPGIYQGQWRMCNPNGYYFGEVIWVILTVSEVGLLGLTQQMSSFNELGSPPRNTTPMLANPFGGPQPGDVKVTHAQNDGLSNCSSNQVFCSISNSCKQPSLQSDHINVQNLAAEETSSFIINEPSSHQLDSKNDTSETELQQLIPKSGSKQQDSVEDMMS